MITTEEFVGDREQWNQNANYCGATRYAAERGHHAALAQGNYWIVVFNDKFSTLSSAHLALSFAKDLARNPGFENVQMATVRDGEVARVADADEIRAARF